VEDEILHYSLSRCIPADRCDERNAIRMSAAIQNVTCLGELKMIVQKEMHPFVDEGRTLQVSKSLGSGQTASGVTWLPSNKSAKLPGHLWQ